MTKVRYKWAVKQYVTHCQLRREGELVSHHAVSLQFSCGLHFLVRTALEAGREEVAELGVGAEWYNFQGATGDIAEVLRPKGQKEADQGHILRILVTKIARDGIGAPAG